MSWLSHLLVFALTLFSALVASTAAASGGASHCYQRDALGQVTRYDYDGDGYLSQLVNPVGAITKLRWGGHFKHAERKLVERVDANGQRVALRYNHEGELLEVENEEREVHQLERDMNGLLVGECLTSITFTHRRQLHLPSYG